MTISICLIGEMRYVEWRGIGRYYMYLVSTSGVATQIERMSSGCSRPTFGDGFAPYWCAGCDEWFTSWTDAEWHSSPSEETLNTVTE